MTGELSPQHRAQACVSCGRGVVPVVAGRQGHLDHITPSAPGPSTDGLALLPHELSSVARSLPRVAGALKETRQTLLTVAFFHPYYFDLWPSLSMLPPAPVKPPHITVHHHPLKQPQVTVHHHPRTHQHMEPQPVLGASHQPTQQGPTSPLTQNPNPLMPLSPMCVCAHRLNSTYQTNHPPQSLTLINIPQHLLHKIPCLAEKVELVSS